MSYFLDFTGFLSEKSKKYLIKDVDNVFRELVEYIKTVKSISTTDQYNSFIKKIISIFKDSKVLPATKSSTYEKEIIPISKSSPLTEKTRWGGVALKKVDVDKNFIKKLLVIAKNGVLGFEVHKQKHENLKVLEGACIVLYSNHASPTWRKGKISIRLAVPGDRIKFLPYDEHGIVALTNCVIEEESTNHLGDLVYIFRVSQVAF